MSQVQRWIVTTAALLVIAVAAVWVLGAVQTARSPEEKCRKVMADIVAEHNGNVSADAYDAGYAACVQQERSQH